MPIKNLHGGEFIKYINVSSNAKNNESFRLSISGVYHPLFEFEPTGSLRLSSAKEKDSGEILVIKTPTKDLQITGVQFKETGKELDWKSSVPIKFSQLPVVDTISPKTAGSKATTQAGKKNADAEQLVWKTMQYKVRISYVPFSTQDVYGEFLIKTNNKDRPEIRISGSLEAKKE